MRKIGLTSTTRPFAHFRTEIKYFIENQLASLPMFQSSKKSLSTKENRASHGRSTYGWRSTTLTTKGWAWPKGMKKTFCEIN